MKDATKTLLPYLKTTRLSQADLPVVRQTHLPRFLVRKALAVVGAGSVVLLVTRAQSTKRRLALGVDHTLTTSGTLLTHGDLSLAHAVVCRTSRIEISDVWWLGVTGNDDLYSLKFERAMIFLGLINRVRVMVS